MMSLMKQLSFKEAVKRQFSFKLKAYHNLVGTLFLFQVIALFFSFYGQSSSITIDYITITNHTYTADIIIAFTLLWIFTVSFYMTNRASKDMMFSFITNKLSNHMANSLYMVTLSALGAITSVLLGVVVRIGMMFYHGFDNLFTYETLSFSQLMLTIFIVFLYHILLFSFGYVIGETIQLHRTFTLLVPLLLFGFFIFTVNVFNEAYLFTFYIMESNIWLFIIKIISSVLIFWLIAIRVGKGLEVRRG